MKSLWPSAIFLLVFPLSSKITVEPTTTKSSLPHCENLFIITVDGFRWQEIFTGADSLLINNENCTPDKETIKSLYWSADPGERRRKLMPFFWNVIAGKGQLWGNRHFGNKADAANFYSISYPGYSEIFTGAADPYISSNRKVKNPNRNVLEYLQSIPAYKNKIAVFSSWDVFPYILNEERSGIPINSGYENSGLSASSEQQFINAVQDTAVGDKRATRKDELTFLTAMEYLKERRPKIICLALGETDEYAHQGRYDLYLLQAAKTDAMIAELWHWVQTTPGYKGNSTFLITTDHGRGSKSSKWATHNAFTKGSSQTWLAIIGPGISPLGEVKEEKQLYQQQIAGTIAGLLGEEFATDKTAAPLSLR